MSIRQAMSWLPLVSMFLFVSVAPQVSAGDAILPGIIVETNAEGQQEYSLTLQILALPIQMSTYHAVAIQHTWLRMMSLIQSILECMRVSSHSHSFATHCEDVWSGCNEYVA